MMLMLVLMLSVHRGRARAFCASIADVLGARQLHMFVLSK